MSRPWLASVSVVTVAMWLASDVSAQLSLPDVRTNRPPAVDPARDFEMRWEQLNSLLQRNNDSACDVNFPNCRSFPPRGGGPPTRVLGKGGIAVLPAELKADLMTPLFVWTPREQVQGDRSEVDRWNKLSETRAPLACNESGVCNMIVPSPFGDANDDPGSLWQCDAPKIKDLVAPPNARCYQLTAHSGGREWIHAFTGWGAFPASGPASNAAVNPGGARFSLHVMHPPSRDQMSMIQAVERALSALDGRWQTEFRPPAMPQGVVAGCAFEPSKFFDGQFGSASVSAYAVSQMGNSQGLLLTSIDFQIQVWRGVRANTMRPATAHELQQAVSGIEKPVSRSIEQACAAPMTGRKINCK